MPESFDFTEDEPRNQTGLKIVAGGLGLLLVVMNVWPQDDSDSSDSQSAAETYPAELASAAAEPVERRIVWPDLLLADVIRTNPFQREPLPAEAADTAETESDRNSDTYAVAADVTLTAETADPPAPRLDLSRYPVKFVFHGPQGAAAMIRDKVYYEGELIDGMEIVRIAEDGVTLQVPPKSSSDK